MITVILTNGPSMQVEEGLTVAQVLAGLGVAADRHIVAAKVNGDMLDLTSPLTRQSTSSAGASS